MLPAQAQAALDALAESLSARPDHIEALRARWSAGGRAVANEAPGAELPADVAAAASVVGDALLALARSEGGAVWLGELVAGPGRDVLLAWCSASVWRRDIQMAALLTGLAARPELVQLVSGIA